MIKLASQINGKRADYLVSGGEKTDSPYGKKYIIPIYIIHKSLFQRDYKQ